MPHMPGKGNRRGRRGRGGRRGFILADTLTAFLIVLMMVPLCMMCIAPFARMFDHSQTVQDEIGAQQLRRVLALSKITDVSGGELCFTYQNRDMRLYQSNRNVILTPGTQYCFTDIDTCGFVIEKGVIWIVLARDDKEVRKALAPLP